MVIDAFRRDKISLDSPMTWIPDTLTTSVYHVVANSAILRNRSLCQWLNTGPPKLPLHEWPADPPAPGLMQLLVSLNPLLSRWAQTILSRCSKLPMSLFQFGGQYASVMTTIEESFSTYARIEQAAGKEDKQGGDRVQFWNGLTTLLQIMPAERLCATSQCSVDVRHLIIGHLHDTGTRWFNFTIAIQTMLDLLKISAPS